MVPAGITWRGGSFIDCLQTLAGALATRDEPTQCSAASAALQAVPHRLSRVEFVTLRAVLIDFIVRTATRRALPPSRLAQALGHCERSDPRTFASAVRHSLDELGCRAPSNGETRDVRVALALQYIRSHATNRRLTVARVAAQVGLSRWHLERLVRHLTGRPLTAHARDARMSAAIRMLETTLLSVKQISTEAGYLNASAFSRDFKRTFGTSPVLWRVAAFRCRAADEAQRPCGDRFDPQGR